MRLCFTCSKMSRGNAANWPPKNTPKASREVLKEFVRTKEMCLENKCQLLPLKTAVQLPKRMVRIPMFSRWLTFQRDFFVRWEFGCWCSHLSAASEVAIFFLSKLVSDPLRVGFASEIPLEKNNPPKKNTHRTNTWIGKNRWDKFVSFGDFCWKRFRDAKATCLWWDYFSGSAAWIRVQQMIHRSVVSRKQKFESSGYSQKTDFQYIILVNTN